MVEEKRAKLTSTAIVADLKKVLKREFISNLFIVLGILLICFGVDSFVNTYLRLLFGVNPIIITTIICVVYLLPVLCVVYAIGIYAVKSKDISNGKYEIVTDKLYRIVEAEFNLKRYLISRNFWVSYDRMFYFENYGEISVPKAKEQTASTGDTFYMVLHKKKPMLIYNEKVYDYKKQ